GILDELTRLVLTNAIYFKGDWASQFKEEDTKPAPFHITRQDQTQVDLMYQKGDFKYAEDDYKQILELPYKGEELSMFVILPKEIEGLNTIDKFLTPRILDEWTRKMYPREIRLYLPKFKMTSEFTLNQVLKEMGMPNAFSNKADFSGMDGTQGLYITAVLHKAFVEVNEEGTEAAAATAVVMGLKAMPARPPVFRADHPFIYLIRDNQTGSILFLGRMMNPSNFLPG
ncbi:MAG: serpin family protein, partial [Sedimentisphaerales bacterium]|nr:serpin family protein [Sedimentisphaerales bacterium]